MKEEGDVTVDCPHCGQPVTFHAEADITLAVRPWPLVEQPRHSYVDGEGMLAFTPPTASGDAHG